MAEPFQQVDDKVAPIQFAAQLRRLLKLLGNMRRRNGVSRLFWLTWANKVPQSGN
jgi:hypothetical protein